MKGHTNLRDKPAALISRVLLFPIILNLRSLLHQSAHLLLTLNIKNIHFLNEIFNLLRY